MNDVEKQELLQWIEHTLDGLESRPEMYALGVEALVAQHTQLLMVRAVLLGKSPERVREEECCACRGPVPVWSSMASLKEAVAWLRSLRAAVEAS